MVASCGGAAGRVDVYDGGRGDGAQAAVWHGGCALVSGGVGALTGVGSCCVG